MKSAGSMQILLHFIRDKTAVCCTARSTGTQQTPRDDFIDLFDKMGGIPSCSVIRSESAVIQHRMQGARGGGALAPVIFALVPCE